MKHLLRCAALLVLTLLAGFAHATGQELRKCDFDLKGGRRSGEARVTLADGAVIRVEVDVIWCGRSGHRKSLDYTCTVNTSRGDGESTWSDDAGATVITDSTPYTDPREPDRIKVTVGHEVSIHLNETQSVPRCGVGAELPESIVISGAQIGLSCAVQRTLAAKHRASLLATPALCGATDEARSALAPAPAISAPCRLGRDRPSVRWPG